MFIELHPYYRDCQPPYGWNKCPETVLNLNLVMKITKMGEKDPEGGNFHNVKWNDDYLSDMTITQAEAETIKKKLLASGQDESLAKEVKALTTAVRDLWNLLRARMR